MPLTEEILRKPGNGYSDPVTDSRVIKIAIGLVTVLENAGYHFDPYEPLSYDGLFTWKKPNMTCIRYEEFPNYWFQITENEIVIMRQNEKSRWGAAIPIRHFPVIEPDSFHYSSPVFEWILTAGVSAE